MVQDRYEYFSCQKIGQKRPQKSGTSLLCVTMHPSSNIHAIPCFTVLPPNCFCDTTYMFPGDAKPNMNILKFIPTYMLLITKMDILIRKQVTLVAQVIPSKR